MRSTRCSLCQFCLPLRSPPFLRPFISMYIILYIWIMYKANNDHQDLFLAAGLGFLILKLEQDFDVSTSLLCLLCAASLPPRHPIASARFAAHTHARTAEAIAHPHRTSHGQHVPHGKYARPRTRRHDVAGTQLALRVRTHTYLETYATTDGTAATHGRIRSRWRRCAMRRERTSQKEGDSASTRSGGSSAPHWLQASAYVRACVR